MKQHLYWLIVRSLQLDLESLKNELSIKDSFQIIIQKYKNLFKWFSFNNLYPFRFEGSSIFVDNFFQYGVIQATFVDNVFLKKIIPENGFIVDVGANIGQFRLMSKTLLKPSKIISIEPIPNTFKLLNKNFPDEEVYQNALSTKKQLKFYIYNESVWSSSIDNGESNADVLVKGIRLDEITEVQQAKVVDLLKIDVEGAELDALEASETVIQKCKYVLVEISLLQNPDMFSEIINKLNRGESTFVLHYIGKQYHNPDKSQLLVFDALFRNTRDF